MKSTKQNIIQAAIQLFNKRGVVNTRIQDIAEAASISPGNLTYHYKTKQDLMHSVFRYMIKTMDEMAFGNRIFVQGDEGIDVAASFIRFQVKFRFFYLDTLEIIRAYPEIRASYQEQVEREINIIRNLIYFAIGKGFFIPEPAEGHFDSLAESIWTILNFRLTQREIRGKTGFAVEEGILELADLYFPYFTEKGKKVYYQMKMKQEREVV